MSRERLHEIAKMSHHDVVELAYKTEIQLDASETRYQRLASALKYDKAGRTVELESYDALLHRLDSFRSALLALAATNGTEYCWCKRPFGADGHHAESCIVARHAFDDAVAVDRREPAQRAMDVAERQLASFGEAKERLRAAAPDRQGISVGADAHKDITTVDSSDGQHLIIGPDIVDVYCSAPGCNEAMRLNVPAGREVIVAAVRCCNHQSITAPDRQEPFYGFKDGKPRVFVPPTFCQCPDCGEEYAPGTDHSCVPDNQARRR